MIEFPKPKALARMIEPPDVATDYAIEVVLEKNKHPIGSLVYLSCLRHLQDLYRYLTDDDYPYLYDAETGELVLDFCKELRHYKGEWAGEPFVPEPWQEFIISSVFSWLKKTDGTRRFRYAYIQIGRKNGKTFLAAAIALWMLLMDGEGGSEVYSAANSKDQAKRTWDDSVKFLKRNEDFHEMITLRYNTVHHHDSDSFYSPLSADSSNLDGLNPHCVIYDELHAADTRTLWDVMEDAFGARSQPLMFIITTAGFNKFSVCYEQRRHCTNVLDSIKNPGLQYHDESYFSYIAEPDEGEDPYSESAWYKGNPNLGVSKNVAYLEEQAEKAKNIPSKEPSFFIKQVDYWTNVSERWLNVNLWLKSEIIEESEALRHQCYAGLDLSTNTDVTAFVRIFEPGTVHPSRYYVLPRFYFPEDNLRMRVLRDKVPYDVWAREGWLQLTPGNSVDLGVIREDVLEKNGETFISALGVDPWKAAALVHDFEEYGMQCFAVQQGYKTMTAPCMLLERMILQGAVAFDGNPMLTWMIGNCAVSYDRNECLKPDKEASNERIDGVAATVTALAVVIEQGGAPPLLTVA